MALVPPNGWKSRPVKLSCRSSVVTEIAVWGFGLHRLSDPDQESTNRRLGSAQAKGLQNVANGGSGLITAIYFLGVRIEYAWNVHRTLIEGGAVLWARKPPTPS